MDRREFVATAAMAAASTALPPIAESQDSDLQPIITQIQKQHDENVQRLQTWIRQPSIAAENRGMQEGCRLDRKSTRLNSSHVEISYAVFCLKKKKKKKNRKNDE